MKRNLVIGTGFVAVLLGLGVGQSFFEKAAAQATGTLMAPKFEVDPSWPKPLPSNWIIGTIGGITVDSRNHIWINQRPSGLDAREKRALTDPNVKCCVPAPPVIEFDPDGKVVQAWGGDGPDYKWGNDGHGIHVDHNNFVWVADNVATGGHVYKFTRDGKFVMQIGKAGQAGTSDSQTSLNRPSAIAVDDAANEVFVADGFGSRRIAVFDATTGAFKRAWGAYGEKPSDATLPAYDPNGTPVRQFRTVSCVKIAKDGMVYV